MDVAGRERRVRAALVVVSVIVAAVLAANLVVLLWAQHEFGPVESMVALHSNMLASGEGIYYDLNRYPYTVSPYGPVFYSSSALLHRAGMPLLREGRCISFLALLAILWTTWRVLGFLGVERFARWTGVLLVGATANLLFWGTMGQVDTLAICFSFAAFAEYLGWRNNRAGWRLWVAGAFAILAFFTKQTALAGAATVAVCLVVEDRRRAAAWIFSVGGVGALAILALNGLTHGHYFADALVSNAVHPFAWDKLAEQLRYFVLTAGVLALVVIVGARSMTRRTAPAYLYFAFAAAMFLATAAKIGSDLNYQVEATVALCLCAACALDGVRFFPRVIAADRGWIPLLQLPLLLFVTLNIALAGKTLLVRVVLEPVKRAEIAALAPFLGGPGDRVICTQMDALVHLHPRLEVETLFYALLVAAGKVDAEPVRRDLADGRFHAVVLDRDVFAMGRVQDESEMLLLPESELQEIRKHYRLVAHVPGAYLNGDYVYQPLPKGATNAHE